MSPKLYKISFYKLHFQLRRGHKIKNVNKHEKKHESRIDYRAGSTTIIIRLQNFITAFCMQKIYNTVQNSISAIISH